MIELLLQAERTLSVGQLDAAERMYWQAVETDPKNSIAVVGLARVALDRGDDRTAYQLARKALEIDAENAAAQRLVARLAEVMQYRGEEVPTEPPPELRRSTGISTAPAPTAAGAATGNPAPAAPPANTASATASAAAAEPVSPASAPAKGKRGIFGRILGRG